MTPSLCWKWLRCSVAALGLLAGGTALACQSECFRTHAAPTPTTLDELRRLDLDQLDELYRRTEMGRPLTGVAEGGLLCVTDQHFRRLKVRLSGAVWRGKGACEDGYFTNRWIGGVEWIDSRYVIGPSWVDARPAVIIEYAPKTPLFANMHDELREVAPGLYFGPLYDRFPCPKLRGYLGLKVVPCKKAKCCAENACGRCARPAGGCDFLISTSPAPAGPPPEPRPVPPGRGPAQ